MNNKNPCRACCERKRVSGFTLVELMVVVGIIGILAAIAYPAYMQYVLASHRAEAKALLTKTAQFMERYFTTHGTYVLDADGATNIPATSPEGATGSAIKYNISFSAGPSATAFSLQAVPSGGQADDKCKTLTLSNTGVPGAAGVTKGAIVVECW